MIILLMLILVAITNKSKDPYDKLFKKTKVAPLEKNKEYAGVIEKYVKGGKTDW